MAKTSKNQKKKSGFIAEVWDFIKVFAITLVIVLLFVNLIAHPVNVVGRSMVPTLQDGEYGFTSLISARLSAPKRGEVVVITMDADEDGDGKTEKTHWVKRVIGLPGDTVESRDDVICVNGEPLDESAYIQVDYKQAMTDQFGYFNKAVDENGQLSDFGPVTLGEDEYWVMGDNRPYSKDSRSSDVGPVTRDKIYGKGVLVLFPFSKIGVH